MAFNPYCYTEARGVKQEWDASRIVPPDRWTYEDLMILCGIPEWSIDAELWYPHLGAN